MSRKQGWSFIFNQKDGSFVYLIKEGEVQKFTGQSIPGFCLVTTKTGLESTIDIEHEVNLVYRSFDQSASWGKDFFSWNEVASDFILPLPLVKKIVQTEFPYAAKRLDRLEDQANKRVYKK